MYKLRFIAPLAIIAFLFMFSTARAEAVRDVTVKDAAELIRDKPVDVLILDARSPEEFQEDHIPHAVNINFKDSNFAKNIGDLPKDKELLIYCNGGAPSTKAVNVISAAGYKNIANMKEGFKAWKDAQYPVEKASSSPSCCP